MKLQILGVGLVAVVIFAAQHGAHATEKSIRGLKLGMTAPQAMQSLPPDLKDGVEVIRINAPSIQRFRLSRGLGCRWSAMNQQAGCIALLAFGHGVPEKGAIYHILLEQLFDHPLEFAAFEQRIKEAYGEPSVFIDSSGNIYSQVHWLWSDEPYALTSEVRELASSTINFAEKVSEPEKKFGSPVLHLSAQVRHGQVTGIHMKLFDPVLQHANTLAGQAWVKKQEEDRARKSVEDARGVQLR